MWVLVGWLLLIIGLQVADRRYKRLRQRAMGGFEQALAVGKRVQPLWKVWGGMAGAVITGFAGSTALGIDGVYGALVVAFFMFVYFERTQYPRILISTKLHGTLVTFEELYSTSIDIDEKCRFLLDEKQLELRDERSQKRIVLIRPDFPDVDFDALYQWLTDMQRGRTVPSQGGVAAISGFRTPEGISDIFFLREEQPIRTLVLLFWVGLLIFGMKRIFG